MRFFPERNHHAGSTSLSDRQRDKKRLGGVELDTGTRELSREGRCVRLQEKPFQVLMALIESGGEVVTRSELQQRLWTEDTFVDFDSGLNTAVRKLRESLGDTPERPLYVQTIPKVGYRWVGPLDENNQNSDRLTSAGKNPRAAFVLILAVAIVAVIGAAFLGRGQFKSNTSSGHQPDARKAFLNGQYQQAKGTIEGYRASAKSFEEAIALEPDFTEAHAALAQSYINLVLNRAIDRDEGARKARQAAQHAVSANPNLAAGHMALGGVRLFLDWDFAGAEEELKRAVSLDPQSAPIHNRLASYYSAVGRYEEALAAKQRAVELDPVSYRLKADLGYHLYALGRYDEAISETHQALELEPSYLPALTVLMQAYDRLGLREQVRSAARRLMSVAGAGEADLARFDQRDTNGAIAYFQRWNLERTQALVENDGIPLMRLASAYVEIGEFARAIETLEESLRRREGFLIFIKTDPQFMKLRDRPEFLNIVRRIGFPSI